MVNSGTVPAARFSLYPEYPPLLGAGAAADWKPEKMTRKLVVGY